LKGKQWKIKEKARIIGDTGLIKSSVLRYFKMTILRVAWKAPAFSV